MIWPGNTDLRRVQGPECSACGCEQSEVVDERESDGQSTENGIARPFRQTTQRRECRNCGCNWQVTLDAAGEIIGQSSGRKPRDAHRRSWLRRMLGE